jgi:hypothetical protein
MAIFLAILESESRHSLNVYNVRNEEALFIVTGQRRMGERTLQRFYIASTIGFWFSV